MRRSTSSFSVQPVEVRIAVLVSRLVHAGLPACSGGRERSTLCGLNEALAVRTRSSSSTAVVLQLQRGCRPLRFRASDRARERRTRMPTTFSRVRRHFSRRGTFFGLLFHSCFSEFLLLPPHCLSASRAFPAASAFYRHGACPLRQAPSTAQ